MQIQLDEGTHKLLRRKAFEKGMSMSALLREALQVYLTGIEQRPLRLEDFTFIASGRSKKSKFDPISERHDEALAEDFGR
jgi:plasmid stability protein